MDDLIEILERKLEQNNRFFEEQMENIPMEQIQSILQDVSLVAEVQVETLKVVITKNEAARAEFSSKLNTIVEMSTERLKLTSTITNTRQLQMMSITDCRYFW